MSTAISIALDIVLIASALAAGWFTSKIHMHRRMGEFQDAIKDMPAKDTAHGLMLSSLAVTLSAAQLNAGELRRQVDKPADLIAQFDDDVAMILRNARLSTLSDLTPGQLAEIVAPHLDEVDRPPVGGERSERGGK